MESSIVIHQETKLIYRCVLEYLSKNFEQDVNTPYHLKRITEVSNSNHIKSITMFPYEGYVKYLDDTVYFKINISDEPLTLGSEDILDYYKEIKFTAQNVSKTFWKSFIKHVYEDFYCKHINYKDQIMLYEFEYGNWEQTDFINKKKLDTIFLPEKQLETIINEVEIFNNNSEKYEELCVPHCSIFLFYGIPGSGKTSLIHAIASHFNFNIATFVFGKDVDDRIAKKALQKIPENTMLVIEDIDCLFGSRKPCDEHRNDVTFSGLLNILDGINHVKDLLIFVTTNHIDKLDPALKRRVHHFVKFDYATKKQKQDMILKYFPNTKTDIVDKLIACKTTMNILQKYLIKSLNEDYIKNPDGFEEFNQEYLDFQNVMYT